MSESRVPWDTKNMTPNVTETDYRNFNVKKYYRQAGQKLNDFISKLYLHRIVSGTSDIANKIAIKIVIVNRHRTDRLSRLA